MLPHLLLRQIKIHNNSLICDQLTRGTDEKSVLPHQSRVVPQHTVYGECTAEVYTVISLIEFIKAENQNASNLTSKLIVIFSYCTSTS